MLSTILLSLPVIICTATIVICVIIVINNDYE
jgi:hypothetical protein